MNLCSGIRDAANLAWKLAAVVRGEAAAPILETYQPEREPNVRAIIGLAMMMGRTVCITDPAAAELRNQQMLAARAAGQSPDGNIAYPPIASGLILAGSDAAGSYFPQPVVGDLRLDDVLGNESWLITRQMLEAPQLQPFAPFLAGWLDQHGAESVLVRPDRHVFGTGHAAELQAQWQEALQHG